MQQIKDMEFSGERPLFASHDLQLDNVVIHAGESALKECSNIIAIGCRFEGKYPFWHVDGFTIKNSLFTEGGRAALWYSQNLVMTDTRVEAPKMFREMDGIRLENVQLPNAQETLWHCRNVELINVQIDHADYLFMHGENIKIRNYAQNGNYSFQYCKNVEIRNAVINSKDAFWNTENVTVYDSEINGEYLGWHSKNLRLVNCKISGTQPLCYAHDLMMENCTMADDCDLAFEYSSVQATINSSIRSVKNPRTGSITAESYGEVILDENIKAPGNCQYVPCPQRQDADESQHEICPRLSFPLRLAVKQIDGTLPADLDHALDVDERENCRKQNHAVYERRRLQCEHIIDTPSHHPQQQHLCRLAEHHAADRAGTDAEQSRKESFPEQHTRDVGFAHAQHMIQSQLGLTALHQEAVRIEQEDYREQADHN